MCFWIEGKIKHQGIQAIVNKDKRPGTSEKKVFRESKQERMSLTPLWKPSTWIRCSAPVLFEWMVETEWFCRYPSFSGSFWLQEWGEGDTAKETLNFKIPHQPGNSTIWKHKFYYTSVRNKTLETMTGFCLSQHVCWLYMSKDIAIPFITLILGTSV